MVIMEQEDLLLKFAQYKLDIRKVCWRITRQCNLSCSFCLAGHRNKLYKEMSFVEIKRCLEALKALGTERISFTGGEPLLRKDFGEILELSHRQGIFNTVCTNGTLLSSFWIDVFKRCVNKVKVSLDGTRDIHNLLRNSNTFDVTYDFIRYLLKHHICVEINYVLLSKNVYCIKDFIGLFSDMPVSRINFLIPMNKEELIDKDFLFPSVGQLRFVEKKLLYLMNKCRMQLSMRRYYNDFYQRPIIESDGTIIKSMSNSKDDIVIGTLRDLKESANLLYV